MNIHLQGSAEKIIDDVLHAQIAVQLLTLKALVDHGVIGGDALLEAMGQISAIGGGSGQIVEFMRENVLAHIERTDPPPLMLTVIEGGLASD
ncbi:hypothetical protein BH09PSE1_BH09PSE1_17670 [soil metagenome]